MLVRMADLNIRIENKHAYIPQLCRKYIVESGEADFSVSASEEDILAETGAEKAPGYAESLAVYRKIAEEMPKFSGFLMHGAVIETDGCGIAFLAKSGEGKSTHVGLWQKLLGDRVQVIQGDKPLVRVLDGAAYAYGTPWAGKERLEENRRTKLRAVCFLSRGAENSIVPCPKAEALWSLMPQIYMPKGGEAFARALEHIETFISSTSFYYLKCNMEIEAAELVYKTILQ